MYFTKLKSLWDELNNFHPSCTCGKCTCDGVKNLETFHQTEYVMTFLLGLNDSFASVRGQLLLMDPLRSINKVFSLIVQEERQRLISLTQPSPVDTNFQSLLLLRCHMSRYNLLHLILIVSSKGGSILYSL